MKGRKRVVLLSIFTLPSCVYRFPFVLRVIAAKCEVKDEEEVHTRACGHSQVWQCYDLVVANFRSVLSKNELDETPKHFQTWELCRLSAVLDS